MPLSDSYCPEMLCHSNHLIAGTDGEAPRDASPFLPKQMVNGIKATFQLKPSSSFSLSPSQHFHTGAVGGMICVNHNTPGTYSAEQLYPWTCLPPPGGRSWEDKSPPEGGWVEVELCRSLLEEVAGGEHWALSGGMRAGCLLAPHQVPEQKGLPRTW